MACKRWPFSFQKATFYRIKDGLSRRKTRPFGKRQDSIRRATIKRLQPNSRQEAFIVTQMKHLFKDVVIYVFYFCSGKFKP